MNNNTTKNTNDSTTVDPNNINVKINLTVPKSSVDNLFRELKQLLNGSKLTEGNVVSILISLMRFIDTFPNLKGYQKKLVILEAMNIMIDDQYVRDDADIEHGENLKTLVSMTLPGVIDAFVEIDKKKIQIKIKKSVKHLIKYCCSFSC